MILLYYHILGGSVIKVFLSELHQLLAEVHLRGTDHGILIGKTDYRPRMLIEVPTYWLFQCYWR